MYYDYYFNQNPYTQFIGYVPYSGMPNQTESIGDYFLENEYTNNIDAKQIFFGRDFNIERENIDLIVNSIYEEGNRLYVDGYIVNLKNNPVYSITNFNLILSDASRRQFANKTFSSIDIQGELRPYQGKRITLEFNSNEYGLYGVDLSKINWDFTYNFR